MQQNFREEDIGRRCVAACLALLLLVAGAGASAAARPDLCCAVSGGTDVASAVVWRGLEFTRAPAVEPWLALEWGIVSFDAAGSWAVDGSWAEQEATAAVSTTGWAGTATLLATGYAFPGATMDLPSPVAELGVEYHVPGPLAARLLVARNVAHDPDGAAVAELGVGHEWSRIGGQLFATVALNHSAYYEADAGTVLQMGAAATHAFQVTPRVAVMAALAGVYSPVHTRGWVLARLALEVPIAEEPPALRAVRPPRPPSNRSTP